MRPFAPSRSALAVVALCGALAAGTSFRSTGAVDEPATSPVAAPEPTRTATPGFYGGSLPPGLAMPGATGSDPEGPGATATRPDPSSTAPLPPSGAGSAQANCPDLEQRPDLPFHEFYFTRAIYGDYRNMRGLGGWGRGGGSWAIDYPKADRQFMVMVDHLVNMDLFPCANAIRLDDPALRRFPFLYALEVGRMRLGDEEVRGLRDYLNAGGFLVIDDFWGTYEWENFEREIRRVLPGRPIVEVPMDHPVFHTVYDIDEILQVPNVRQGQAGGPTHERDGYVPYVLGIFDDHDRLMVVINFNTDLGDAWEWAEDPFYPLRFSTFAAEMGVNMIVYAMSH